MPDFKETMPGVVFIINSIFMKSSLTDSVYSLSNNSNFDNPEALGLFSVNSHGGKLLKNIRT